MQDPDDNLAAQISLIGCCGACCRTCRPFLDKTCKGCKPGYDDGKRDIRAARCAMKRCCILIKKVNTCADCSEYAECRMIQGFFEKNGYKYKKYRQSLEFIRKYGYLAFIEASRSWKCAYGSLKSPE